jgi:hypothetical protein
MTKYRTIKERFSNGKFSKTNIKHHIRKTPLTRDYRATGTTILQLWLFSLSAMNLPLENLSSTCRKPLKNVHIMYRIHLTSSLLSMSVIFASFVRAKNDNSGRDCQSSEQTSWHLLVDELCPVANKLCVLGVLPGIFINIRIVCFTFFKKIKEY